MVRDSVFYRSVWVGRLDLVDVFPNSPNYAWYPKKQAVCNSEK
jgi:hypothetical protein